MKNLKSHLLVTILLTAALVPVSTIAQHKPPIEIIMRDNIRKLKDGVLLVRLQNREQAISALRKNGQEAQAKQLEEKQVAFNKEIIKAFHTHFNFCPVLFFYSGYSEHIISGNAEGVVFLNDSLQPDPAIRMKGNGFLTAEFGTLQQDTAAFMQDHYYYGADGKKEQRSVAGGADQKLPVLRIMDEKFIQLTNPFPYYVRTYQDPPTVKKINKVVAKMNAMLKEYYAWNK